MSRILSHPFEDFVSVAVVPSSSVSGDSRTVDALVAIRSLFNVDSTVTTCRLVEVRKNYFIHPCYELHAPLPGEYPYDTFSCGFSLFTDALEVGLRFPLHPCYGSGIVAIQELFITCFRLSRGQAKYYLAARSEFRVSSFRKCIWKAVAKQPTNASGSTARTSTDKGKGIVELEEVLERGYTMWELCEVEDRAGADKYFTSIMTRPRCADSKGPLVPRWSTISRSASFGPRVRCPRSTCEGLYTPSCEASKGCLFSPFLILPSNLPLCLQGLHFASALISRIHDASRLVRSQHEKILTLWAANKELKTRVGQELVAVTERQAKELEGEVKSQRREIEQEVGLLRSSLDGARNGRARLEGDVLSLTEVAAFLEAELKAEGP
ncbi:hypothetical protein B296_00045597 [Ensete ventricosum]|uniref:Uncharacterized protein n=1 Tax=Ensete ventricosum TaxID=4639 RepID=A0A426Z6Y3_ENSVE|nr:hypothetical protein B296_00045597 [Ensete ventricosum]